MKEKSPIFDKPAKIQDLLEELGDLYDEVESEEAQAQIEDVINTASRLNSGVFGQTIKKYTTRDMAESVVGSILLALPLLVEDGVYDIGAFFVETTVLGIPSLLIIVNILFVILVTVAVLYWADFQKVVPQKPICGLVPRRLVGVLTISFLTTALLMTLWGRVDGWEDPYTALGRIVCVWTAAAFGAALGDILPGTSQGRDISETFKPRSIEPSSTGV